jgi:hypothetical protein
MSRVFTISKLSRNGRPYVLKTVSDLPCSTPHELHWYLWHRVCAFYGPGTFYVARSHDQGERRGFVLVAKIRISKEAIGLLRTDTSHSVFPNDPAGRQAYWEQGGDFRWVRIGLKKAQVPPSLGGALSRITAGDGIPQMKGRGIRRARPGDWAWKINKLFKGTKPSKYFS